VRAKEFIGEQKLSGEENYTLPATHVLPNLPNQDPYLQYRMGLVLASSGPDQTLAEPESPWGENMVVTAYSSGEEEILKTALKVTSQPSSMITTAKSEEPKNINKQSPVLKKKKNRYGV
jgi:hypothetical protein